jgi:broad specificity phosphatase PhoE
MERPNNRWGDATFRDDETMTDAGLLSDERRAQNELKQLQQDILSVVQQRYPQRRNNNNNSKPILVLTSPLTRCLQTCEAVRSCLVQECLDCKIRAEPLLTERVYTASDTGRLRPELRNDFPHVEFPSPLLEQPWWWYQRDDDDDENSYEEWRPHGDGQYYAVKGEPCAAFEERMQKLRDYLDAIDEEFFIVVTHWGVLRHLLSVGTTTMEEAGEFRNGEARLVEWTTARQGPNAGARN